MSSRHINAVSGDGPSMLFGCRPKHSNQVLVVYRHKTDRQERNTSTQACCRLVFLSSSYSSQMHLWEWCISAPQHALFTHHVPVTHFYTQNKESSWWSVQLASAIHRCISFLLWEYQEGLVYMYVLLRKSESPFVLAPVLVTLKWV